MQKTIRYWWKKPKKTQTDGEIYNVLGWKDQYCQNDYTTKGNLQIQCNSYQITNGIFHRTRTKYLQFVWKHKKTQIGKGIL